jgi:hypothetical protein
MVKGEVVPALTMKVYSRSEDVTPLILNLGSTGRTVVRITLRPFYPNGKRSICLLYRRFGRIYSLSGRSGEEKNILLLLVFKTQTVQPSG